MKFDNLEQRVRAAKENDAELNELIREYIPFIRQKVLTTVPADRYDSFSSTGMAAFAEAIGKFDSDKGSFLGFAGIVIKRRVTDQIRREYRPDEIPSESIEEFADMDERSGRAIEIGWFRNELGEYGILLDELIKSCPRHRGSRERADRAAEVLAETKDLMDALTETKRVPVKKLSELADVPIKLIDKKRKYIIARALLKGGKYGYLKEYIE